MGTRFRRLDVPEYWEQYWSKYPQGYTILEALLNWVAQVDSMVDNINDWNTYLDQFVLTFDTELQEKVTLVIQDWQASGVLDDIISSALNTQATELRADVGERTGLPTWLQTNLYSAVKMHDDYLRSMGVNIKMPPYNAKGNGVDDDAPIIQDAIDAVAASGGGVITIPVGTFILRSSLTLKEGITIIGAGMVYRETGGTILKCKGDINGITTGLIDSDSSDMRSIILANFLLRGDDEILDTNKTKYGLTGSHLRYNVTIYNVAIKHFLDGINLSQAWSLDMYKVISNYNGRHGAQFYNAANRINIIGCEFNQNEVVGFLIPSTGVITSQGIMLLGCLFEKNGSYGAQINHTQNVEIRQCYFEANGGIADYQLFLRGLANFENYTVLLQGNRFYTTETTAQTAVNIADFTYNVEIGGNYFHNFDTAIRVVTGANQNIVLMPNTYLECTTKLLEVGSQGQVTVVGKPLT